MAVCHTMTDIKTKMVSGIILRPFLDQLLILTLCPKPYLGKLSWSPSEEAKHNCNWLTGFGVYDFLLYNNV